jgi:ABC-type multidrug transport system permease subunit
MTPRLRIFAGILLLVAGAAVGMLYLSLPPGGLRVLAVGVAWTVSISGLALLFFRYSEALISTGVTLLLVSPLILFQSILVPIRVAFFLVFVPAVAVASFGVYLIVLGRAERRREAAA